MVSRSAGSGFRRRDTGYRVPNLDQVHKEGISFPASMRNAAKDQVLDQLGVVLLDRVKSDGRTRPCPSGTPKHSARVVRK